MNRTVFLLCAALVLPACTHTATYNQAHFEPQPIAQDQKLEGKALIFTDKQDDVYVYSGKPTSFTGGGTTLTIPLGLITREAATLAFGDLFRGGAERASELGRAAGYAAVIRPRTRSFSYEYNQLKNIGFAITPTVVISIDVSLLDEHGKPFFEKTYESGTYEGPAYMISGSPGEDIGKAAHRAIYGLMLKAGADTREQLKSRAGTRERQL